MKNLMVVSLLVSSIASLAIAKSEKQSTALENAVATFRSMESNQFLLETVVRAHPVLKSELEISPGPLPQVKIAGDKIEIEGLKYPLKVLDLNAGTFSLNGTVLDFSRAENPEQMIKRIQQAASEKSSTLQILFGQPAYAAVPVLPAILATWAIGSLGYSGACSFLFSMAKIRANVDTRIKQPSGYLESCIVKPAVWPIVLAGYIVGKAIAAPALDRLDCTGEGSLSFGNRRLELGKFGEGSNGTVPKPVFEAAVATLNRACSSKKLVLDLNVQSSANRPGSEAAGAK